MLVKKLFFIHIASKYKFYKFHFRELTKKDRSFGEVLENIEKDYVDDNQSENDGLAINGVLQSLDPYSAYMSLNYLKKCKLILVENLEVLGSR